MDTYCNQVLRSTFSNEMLSGPGAPRFGWLPFTDIPQLAMRRWPVTEVLAIQTSPMRSLPRVWTPLQSTQYEIEYPLINMYTDSASATAPDGGYTILLAEGTIFRTQPRNSVRALVSYLNGWPHTSLTAPAAAGARTISVDDVTGWIGAQGMVYDDSATEAVSGLSVAATTPVSLPNGIGTVQSGPGTITLSSPLTYAHAAGVLVSALPANVQLAAIFSCVLQALESGIESITAETLPGSETIAGHGAAWIEAEFRSMLDPYRRTV